MKNEEMNGLLREGEQVRDKWKVERKLGQGGFGQIFKARDEEKQRDVAIKVESIKCPKQLLRMEVAVLRRLQGTPHAVKFLGSGRNEVYK